VGICDPVNSSRVLLRVIDYGSADAMKTITVKLNEHDVVISPLKTRATATWLKKVEVEIRGITDIVLSAPDTDLTDYEAIRGLVSSAVGAIPDVLDKILDLMIEFSPDNKDIIEECYPDEAFAAFVEVVLLALPFDQVMPKLRAITSNIPQT